MEYEISRVIIMLKYIIYAFKCDDITLLRNSGCVIKLIV